MTCEHKKLVPVVGNSEFKCSDCGSYWRWDESEYGWIKKHLKGSE